MKNRTYLYVVEYRLHKNDDPKSIRVIAHDKWEAYDKAVYELIPKEDGRTPYSCWVYAVQYQNGNYRVIAKSESMY